MVKEVFGLVGGIAGMVSAGKADVPTLIKNAGSTAGAFTFSTCFAAPSMEEYLE